MASSFIPTNSIEYEMITTIPAWGDVAEVDLNTDQDKNGAPYDTPRLFKSMALFSRDFRLGNISLRYDDITYLEDSARLAHILLIRRYENQAYIAAARVAATLELSQSRGGFFRKNSRSIHQYGETTTEDKTAGGFGTLFKKKNKEGF